MSFRFNARDGLIVVRAEIVGPRDRVQARLALDTGATITLVRPALLLYVGYDPATAPDRVAITTGSGVEYAPRLPVQRIEALGQTRSNFSMIAHTLPPSATVDGVLGLDFLRGHELVIDFRSGEIIVR